MRGALGGPRLLLAPPPRGHGGAGQRAGAPRQDRRPHRQQHGGGGLLVLRAAGRRHPRALRHRGPEPRRRPPHHHAGRRGPGRPDRAEGPAAQPAQRAVAPRLLLQAGDRRGDLPVLPRRAGAARRQHARRARRAEPRPPPLFRGGGRGDADHGHGAGRDHRLGRTADAGAPGRRHRAAPAAARHRPGLSDGVGLGHVVLHEPRVVVSNLIADDCAREVARLDEAIADLRSSIDATDRTAATSPRAASTATCSKPSACSPTTRAGCAGCARRC